MDSVRSVEKRWIKGNIYQCRYPLFINNNLIRRIYIVIKNILKYNPILYNIGLYLRKNYKPKEFAELLNVSVLTLQRWDNAGKLFIQEFQLLTKKMI